MNPPPFDPSISIIHLIGPTCVGKGLTGSCLIAAFPDLGLISTGQLARDERKRNKRFDEEYGPVMDRGDRLEKDVMDGLFYRALFENLERNFILDGYIRSVAQAEESLRLGLLGSNAIVFNLKACQDTCMRRFSHRTTSQNRSDDKAGAETFNHRYALHEGTISSILARISETEAKVIDVDANDHLHIVASCIIGHWVRFAYLSRATRQHLSPSMRTA